MTAKKNMTKKEKKKKKKRITEGCGSGRELQRKGAGVCGLLENNRCIDPVAEKDGETKEAGRVRFRKKKGGNGPKTAPGLPW